MEPFNLPKPPQLLFGPAESVHVTSSRWKLWSEGDCRLGDKALVLEIERAWNGESWNSYRAWTWEHGVRREVVDAAELDRMVLEHEEMFGEKPDDRWWDQFELAEIKQACRVRDALIAHWEAMLRLGLFTPAVTL